MRISDWISDVCSSDLPVSVALDRYAAIGKSARNAWALRVSGGTDTVAASPGLAVSFYGQAGIIGDRAHDGYADRWNKMDTPIGAGCGEHGRAPCRERGCQYVYNSVAAVSLKTKIK